MNESFEHLLTPILNYTNIENFESLFIKGNNTIFIKSIGFNTVINDSKLTEDFWNKLSQIKQNMCLPQLINHKNKTISWLYFKGNISLVIRKNATYINKSGENIFFKYNQDYIKNLVKNNNVVCLNNHIVSNAHNINYHIDHNSLIEHLFFLNPEKILIPILNNQSIKIIYSLLKSGLSNLMVGYRGVNIESQWLMLTQEIDIPFDLSKGILNNNFSKPYLSD